VSATLRRVRADELEEWAAAARAGYAASIERDGGIPRDEAAQKAERDVAELLGAGLDSPGQHLFVVEADGEAVGRLWLGERRRRLWVYEVAIDEAARGRGLGRAAMELAEEVARELGYGVVGLNVFGGNTTARGLYRSLGYREVAVEMEKEL